MRKLPSKAVQKYAQNIERALSMAKLSFEEVDGFMGFEHEQQWFDFPNSLRISCFFISEEHMQRVLSKQEAELIKILQLSFLKVGVKFRYIRNNVIFCVSSA